LLVLKCNVSVLTKYERKMNIILIILSFLAILAAFESALRARDKLVFNYTQRSASRMPSLDEPERLSSSVKQSLEPDQDSIAEILVSNPSGSESAFDSVSSDSVPLATSLTVSELLSSGEGENAKVQNLHADDPLETGERTLAHSTSSVLEEITRLEQAESKERIAQLAQFIDHPDTALRVAIAATLGELAAKTQGDDRQALITLLNHLTQDVDMQVRVQAAASLGAMPHQGE
jgi:hypothetical protein